jgi:hypothetical protein
MGRGIVVGLGLGGGLSTCQRGCPQIVVGGSGGSRWTGSLPIVSDRFYPYRVIHEAGFPRQRLRTGVTKQEVVRLTRGVYAPPRGEPLRGIRSLFTRLPDGAALGYESAAALHGFGPAPPVDHPLQIVVPAGTIRPRVQGIVCHEAVLEIPAPTMRHGIPCVPPARCAVDLARRRRRMTGLATLDACLHHGACTAAELAEEVLLHDGLRGVRQARELVALADGRAECAQESHLRLIVIDGGLPAPEPQLWVFDDAGVGVFRLDLGYREARVGLEYDGRSHLSAGRLAADRSRMNWLSSHRWTMRYFTARDIYQTPGLVVSVVRAALGP